MPTIQRRQVVQATKPTPWDVSNGVLYDLCRDRPAHRTQGEIVAKILLVGRVYAAAIERRRSKADGEGNEDFYLNVVAREVRKSRIDSWLAAARRVKPGTPEALDALIDVHGRTTRLFGKISGLEKRSLASKYLHFHVPDLFYIYDSRACEAMRRFAPILSRATSTKGRGDNEYRKFAEKCAHLAGVCEREHGVRLSPREIDNLLLRESKR